jgi:hypothetical protein
MVRVWEFIGCTTGFGKYYLVDVTEFLQVMIEQADGHVY